MLVIAKKDFPKDLNPLGLKRGDKVEIEIGDASPDFLTLDPTTLKLKTMSNPADPRPPLVKLPKPKSTMANMPLPALKAHIQTPPMATPPAPMTPPPAPMPPMK